MNVTVPFLISSIHVKSNLKLDLYRLLRYNYYSKGIISIQMTDRTVQSDRISLQEAYQNALEQDCWQSDYSQPPMFEDSGIASSVTYPQCTLGVLTAESDWGNQTGVAFVINDKNLLTCASNCYSHKFGLHTNLTFTIKSTTTEEYDTYKISKTFIPEQYKAQGQQQSKHNYAILYIESQAHVRDRYGNLALSHHLPTYFEGLTQFQFTLLEQKEVFALVKDFSSKKSHLSVDGGPILHDDRVVGLTFRNKEGKPDFLIIECLTKLDQWIMISKMNIDTSVVSFEKSNFNRLKKYQHTPIDKITKNQRKPRHIRQEQKHAVWQIQKLPFSSLNSLQLKFCQFDPQQLNFFHLDKFRNLRQLIVWVCNLNAEGCKYIANAPLPFLKRLELQNSDIGAQGCKHLARGNWPFLRQLELGSCKIENEGLFCLCSKKWVNLMALKIIGLESIFQISNLPHIKELKLYENPGVRDLSFLNYPSWGSIETLDLRQCKIGNRGCRLIKQSGLSLTKLSLTECSIDSSGLKWLCKANLKKMNYFSLDDKLLGERGFLALSRASMPRLQALDFYPTNAVQGGRQRLILMADWPNQTIRQRFLFHRDDIRTMFLRSKQ